MSKLIFEKSLLIKLFYNESLQDKYLDDLLPGVFTEYKLLAFMMKQLRRSKTRFTIDNLILMQESDKVKAFMNKNKISGLYTYDSLDDIFNDLTANKSTEYFKEAYEVVHDDAFFRFVAESKEEFTYANAYNDRGLVLARAKALIKLNDILFKRKVKRREDGIFNAINFINNKKAYIPTFSNKLNSVIGGLSRGFAASIIARPSHGKSTFATWDSMWSLNNDIVDEVTILSGEEPEEIFWRRIISSEFKIPSEMLRSGEYKVSKEQYHKMKDKYADRLKFFRVSSLEETIDVLMTVKSELIFLDHVNSIRYPYGDDVKGIKELVRRENEFLEDNKDSVLVNLSQVNVKNMKHAGRLFPTKEDALGSSYLEIASREFLSVYYPYLDAIDPETNKAFHKKKNNYLAVPDRIQISIEKNSFGSKGIHTLKFHNTIGRYEDTDELPTGTNAILPEEKTGTLSEDDISSMLSMGLDFKGGS